MKKLQYWLRQLFNMLLLFLGGKRKEETIAKKAYRLLSPVPAENWLERRFTNTEDKCCFMGHYQRLTSLDPNDYSNYNCCDFAHVQKTISLRETTRRFLWKKHKIACDGSDVNNEHTNGYTEDNPKDRVMHLLQDMIKAGY